MGRLKPKNRRCIVIDPLTDKTLVHIFNDLQNVECVPFCYEGDDRRKKTWESVSRKIGVKCKELINADPPFLFPVSNSRYHRMGFVTRPPSTDIAVEPFGKELKIWFQRKHF